MKKTAGRLKQNPADDRQQTQTIDERGQHLKALITKGSFRVGCSLADMKRHCSQAECHRIGQHMTRIGEQGKRSGDNASDHFDDHERTRQNQRNQYPPQIALVRLMTVIVIVCHISCHLFLDSIDRSG